MPRFVVTLVLRVVASLFVLTLVSQLDVLS
jgi:hypothetical protein